MSGVTGRHMSGRCLGRFDRRFRQMDSTKQIELELIDGEQKFAARQHRAIKMFRASIPDRFEGAKLSTFQISSDATEATKQRAVTATLCSICHSINAFCSEVNQLFIWGRVGTGKDHLAIAVAKQAALAGYSCRWFDAATLYERVSDWTKREQALSKATAPDIIILSDAVCNRNWSEGKQLALRRIANDRWNANKATWVTANVTSVFGCDANCAESLMVKDTLDRLLDGAAQVHCDWSSYRATRTWKQPA